MFTMNNTYLSAIIDRISLILRECCYLNVNIKLLTIFICCCCDSPAALLLSSVVQVEVRKSATAAGLSHRSWHCHQWSRCNKWTNKGIIRQIWTVSELASSSEFWNSNHFELTINSHRLGIIGLKIQQLTRARAGIKGSQVRPMTKGSCPL